MSIPVFRPFIKRSDMNAVLTCLVSEKIGPGHEAAHVTRALLKTIAYPEGALLRERLRGIEIALHTLGVTAGSRIALSPLSDRSYRYVIESLSMEPVYIDSIAHTPAMNIEELERIHSEKPLQGVLLDHHLGFYPDMELLSKQKIGIIQDISHIISPAQKDGAANSYVGDVCLMSLEAKNLVTAGGGIFLAAKKKSMDIKKILNSYPNDIYLPDMNAALGGIQIEELARFLDIRKDIREVLLRTPSHHRFLSAEKHNEGASLAMLLKGPMQEVIQYGAKHAIEIVPAFEHSIIQSMLRDYKVSDSPHNPPAERYPESTRFALQTITLPLYPGLKKKDVENIQRLVKTLP